MSIEISDQDFARLLREKARAGDPEFKYGIGYCYYRGIGIKESYIEALKWIKPAAEQGHVDAQFHLGYMLSLGEGISSDKEEAAKWYQLSANQGHAVAQNNLARCYRDGEGVTQSYDKAIHLLNLSSGQGYWRASLNLGVLYESGTGVEQDLATAKLYYQKALADSALGNDPANEADILDIREKLGKIDTMFVDAEKKAVAAREAERTEVFISYAHKDEQYKNELHPYLQMLKKTTEIKWWDDTHIKPGEDWNKQINGALSKAKIAVLMISANFFASNYIWSEELPKLLEAAEQEGATILWVPVRTCPYEDTGIAKYQAITDPKKPLTKCNDAERDDVYTALVKRIKELLKPLMPE
ncbi:MAG: TIR domain-containing protein [Clostridia bacterium]|nr:TIR domain-containing protein [Clostridia bacterium]